MERYEQGTHFAAPTEHAIVGAEDLERRFGLPRWRYMNDRLLAGCTAVIERYGPPAPRSTSARRAASRSRRRRSSTTRPSRRRTTAELADLAWLFNMNRGIFMTPGREEEWTLSATHTDESVDRYVVVFEEMARELTA